MVRTCTRCLASPAQTYQLPPGHSASLKIRNTVVSRKIPMAIRIAAYRADTEKYIIHVAGWDTTIQQPKFTTWWIGQQDMRQAKHSEDHVK